MVMVDFSNPGWSVQVKQSENSARDPRFRGRSGGSAAIKCKRVHVLIPMFPDARPGRQPASGMSMARIRTTWAPPPALHLLIVLSASAFASQGQIRCDSSAFAYLGELWRNWTTFAPLDAVPRRGVVFGGTARRDLRLKGGWILGCSLV